MNEDSNNTETPSSFDDLMGDSSIDETLETSQSQRMIGKYPVIRKLGQGAMGEVWLAQHPDLDVKVAIKTLPNHLAEQNPGYVDRFIREARTAARINHSHVVRVYDCGVDNGTNYMVMEYVDGGDIKQLQAKTGALPLDQSLEIITSVAEALKEAAAFHIIHRDIKPENIMRDSRGIVKLADLGLAKIRHNAEDMEMTRSGATVGSPKYIAPEQVQNSKSVDARADIYSLGATFFHLVTGEAPFHAESSFEMMLKHVEEPLPDPSSLNPDLPRDVCDVIRKMTQKEPDARYQTAEDLLSDLKKLQLKYSGENTMELIAATKPGHEKKLLVVAVVIILGLVGFILKDKILKPSPEPKPLGDSPPVLGAEIKLEEPSAPPEFEREFTLSNLGATMLPVPAGTFKMGKPDGRKMEGPEHTVIITQSFWMGQCEITTGQFRKFAASTDYRTDAEKQGASKVCERQQNRISWVTRDGASWKTVHDDDRRPVVCVSWNDARAFCAWLNDIEAKAGRLPKGYEYRLPTEAEWEYACRAGTTTSRYWGDDYKKMNTYEWQNYESIRANVVGDFKPNPWGFHDMIGNVAEICLDAVQSKGHEIVADTFVDDIKDPLNTAGSDRSLRGATWMTSPSRAYCASRSSINARFNSASIGFRIALAPVMTDQIGE